MNRRIVSAIGAIAGLVVIVLAVCSATIWRPSSTVHASVSPTDQHYILVEPAVLGLVDSDVTISATAQGQLVTLALGYSTDARAWLADDPYLSVTGLKDWSTLESTAVTQRCQADAATPAPSATTADPTASVTPSAQAGAEPSASAGGGCEELANSDANPATADVWQLVESGNGTVSIDIDATDSDLVLLAATDGAHTAPQLTLTWHRAVTTPLLVPLLVLGGLLILAGVFGFLLDVQIRHADEERRRRAAERAARIANADSVSTVGIPRIGDPNRPLTRREMREKERAEKAGEVWIDPRQPARLSQKDEADSPVAASVAGAQTEIIEGIPTPQDEDYDHRGSNDPADENTTEGRDEAAESAEVGAGAEAASADDASDESESMHSADEDTAEEETDSADGQSQDEPGEDNDSREVPDKADDSEVEPESSSEQGEADSDGEETASEDTSDEETPHPADSPIPEQVNEAGNDEEHESEPTHADQPAQSEGSARPEAEDTREHQAPGEAGESEPDTHDEIGEQTDSAAPDDQSEVSQADESDETEETRK